MNAIDQYYVPQLVDNYSIVPFNGSSFTLCIDDDSPRKFNIHAPTVKLLNLIDGKKNLTELADSFNHSSDVKLNRDDILQIFNAQLLGYGILAGDNMARLKVKNNYITPKITLFPSPLVSLVAGKLTFLFGEKIFQRVFLLTILFIAGSFLFALDFDQLKAGVNANFVGWLILANLSGLILHEFGHAAACIRFGARNGPIGFGFYVFTPVFYSDVSDAWRLSRKQRIIVDLGGIYMQLLFTAAFVLTYFITAKVVLLQIAFVMAGFTVWNLSPFLRYDGYWALCDILNISNLNEKSARVVNQFLGYIVGMNKTWRFSKQNTFFFVFGLTRLVSLIAFVTYMVVLNEDSIIYFPLNLYNFIHGIFTQPAINFTWIRDTFIELVMPLMFYIMVVRSLVHGIKTKYFRKSA
jgi:putative peptide zinc metalloprotease protein